MARVIQIEQRDLDKAANVEIFAGAQNFHNLLSGVNF